MEGKGKPKKEDSRHPRREYTKRQVTRIGKKTSSSGGNGDQEYKYYGKKKIQ